MKHLYIAIILLLTACSSMEGVNIPKEEWAKVKTPTTGTTKIYGTYNNGCLAGGKVINSSGNGFHMARLSRRRNYAHPEMIDYLNSLGWVLSQNGYYMLVADVGQPRGGPIVGGHSSHQIGLDVDIWYSSPDGSFNEITSHHLENIAAPSMVKPNRHISRQLFGEREFALIRAAAGFAQVDRIFVNPAVKEELCRNNAGEGWMAKVRPWWGHDRHFHVRLKCPAYERDCVSQHPVDMNDGCGNNLNWWFGDEASAPETQTRAQTEVRILNGIPAECLDVLRAP
jgi:penicillin-insensitive murein DD-endopeptidase